MKILTMLTLCLGTLFCAKAFVFAKPTARPNYRVTIDSKDPRRLTIEAETTVKRGILHMSDLGAEQFPARWAKFVSGLSVTSKSGKKVEAIDLGDAKWKLDAKPGEIVGLKYHVQLDHDKHPWGAGLDSVSFVRDWGIYAAGRTYLITDGAANEGVDICFNLPKGWRITTPWLANKGKANCFIARNSEELTDSMVFAGMHKEFVMSRNGFELRFALGGDLAADEGKYRSLANGVMDYYIDLMGGIPKPPPSNPLSRAVVILNPGEQTDGEVIGNNICIIVGTRNDPMSELFAKFIFAHEFFHLWNGKSIRPAGTEDEWLKEGFTNIYAMKALYHLGAITESELFSTLDGLFFKRYSTDPSYGRASMREVASGDDKHRHWGLIYGGGMFAGMCADSIIRRKTANNKSLDDLMRAFFVQYGGSDSTYATPEIAKSISGLSGSDMSDFFASYIYGKEAVPIDQCLREMGLDSSIQDGKLKIARKPTTTESEDRMIDIFLGKKPRSN